MMQPRVNWSFDPSKLMVAEITEVGTEEDEGLGVPHGWKQLIIDNTPGSYTRDLVGLSGTVEKQPGYTLDGGVLSSGTKVYMRVRGWSESKGVIFDILGRVGDLEDCECDDDDDDDDDDLCGPGGCIDDREKCCVWGSVLQSCPTNFSPWVFSHHLTCNQFFYATLTAFLCEYGYCAYRFSMYSWYLTKEQLRGGIKLLHPIWGLFRFRDNYEYVLTCEVVAVFITLPCADGPPPLPPQAYFTDAPCYDPATGVVDSACHYMDCFLEGECDHGPPRIPHYPRLPGGLPSNPGIQPPQRPSPIDPPILPPPGGGLLPPSNPAPSPPWVGMPPPAPPGGGVIIPPGGNLPPPGGGLPIPPRPPDDGDEPPPVFLPPPPGGGFPPQPPPLHPPDDGAFHISPPIPNLPPVLPPRDGYFYIDPIRPPTLPPGDGYFYINPIGMRPNPVLTGNDDLLFYANSRRLASVVPPRSHVFVGARLTDRPTHLYSNSSAYESVIGIGRTKTSAWIARPYDFLFESSFPPHTYDFLESEMTASASAGWNSLGTVYDYLESTPLNDYAPGSARMILLESDGAGNKTITGLSMGQVDGQEVVICNIGTVGNILLTWESSSSSAGNRFNNAPSIGSDTILPGGRVIYKYSSSLSRWVKMR